MNDSLLPAVMAVRPSSRPDNAHPLYGREQAVEYRPGTALVYRFNSRGL
jgi:hypothetical protein